MKYYSALSLTVFTSLVMAMNAQAVTIIFPYEEQQQQLQPNDTSSLFPTVAPVITSDSPQDSVVVQPILPAANNTESDIMSAPSAVAGDRYALRCTPTPATSRYAYPGKKSVATSNMLARPQGKSIFVDGQRLYLTGRVFDAGCVPLREARVEIWQADSKGNYRYPLAGEMSNPYAIFAGAGQVETDNRGEYVFETIFPAPLINQAPYINMRVSHPALRTPLITTLYFEGDVRNERDVMYQRFSVDTKQKITSPVLPFDVDNITRGVRVHHDITVGARDGFRGF